MRGGPPRPSSPRMLLSSRRTANIRPRRRMASDCTELRRTKFGNCAWPVASACARRPRAPAATPTSANAAPAIGPPPPPWRSSPPSASTPRRWSEMSKNPDLEDPAGSRQRVPPAEQTCRLDQAMTLSGTRHPLRQTRRHLKAATCRYTDPRPLPASLPGSTADREGRSTGGPSRGPRRAIVGRRVRSRCCDDRPNPPTVS